VSTECLGLNLVPVHHCFSSTHKTESIYRRYAIVSEADLKEGVTKLAWLHKSQGVPARPTVIPLSDSRRTSVGTTDCLSRRGAVGGSARSKLNWSLATETQRVRIQRLAATVRRLTAENHRLRGELKRHSK
jgi:hypothetical protein